MKLLVLTNKQIDLVRQEITTSQLPMATKASMLTAINELCSSGVDAFTVYQLGYAKGFVNGINAAAKMPSESARQSYDEYCRSMDGDVTRSK